MIVLDEIGLLNMMSTYYHDYLQVIKQNDIHKDTPYTPQNTETLRCTALRKNPSPIPLGFENENYLIAVGDQFNECIECREWIHK